ncbi:beta-L-arabinofuranosidase (glycosyl hydrolase family 127) [Pedobacter metabolipauper]|uniref:Beta-L-arabinofuranosidase (Glycosyl hydrolase family 127) n=1 Tax=Pedobacter metabolipauper TaxID=425513 RepID=A0A4R6ST58_9SPHI|nr:beta-L-arabinofuranosidase (glycosyl hydrolase family 127) [Pedobacter metabolipauper]
MLCLSLGCLSAGAQNNFAVFQETPVNSLTPKGWMRNMLERQRDGLTGHIAVAGDPFDKEGWGYAENKKMNDWAQYEQTGYWADGALRCGYLIGDKALQEKVREWIRFQINNPDSTGFIGPKDISFLWPEVVFFRAVMAEYEATGDKKIINALKRNYHSPKYVSLSGAPGQDDFFKDRLILHIEMLCWIYQQTGESFFIQKSEDAYKAFNASGGQYSIQAMNADDVPRSHSVSYSENLKIPIILYISTGKKEYLDAALKGVHKLYKYHGLVDGLTSGNELHDGNFSNEVHETCTVSDMQWALGYLLQATGDAQWGDLIEKICFNAGMGSVTKDFKSYQYYSGPNQVIADGLSSHWNDHEPWYMTSRDRSAFKINHRPSCCGGNVNRMLPVFCSRMWMKSGDTGIVAALYSASVYNTKLKGVKGEVTIKEETNYPFDQNVRFRIALDKKANFTLSFRIPSWCDSAKVLINGKPSDLKCDAGTFAKLDRLFNNGDVIDLLLPMTVKPVYLPENGIAFERGPLVYSLSIDAKTEIKGSKTNENVVFNSTFKTPVSAWNLAPLGKSNVEVVQTSDFSDPWNPDTTPVKLTLDAVAIKNWSLYRETYTPQLPSVIDLGKEQKMTLVPMGTTELRLTVFPDLLKRYDQNAIK